MRKGFRGTVATQLPGMTDGLTLSGTAVIAGYAAVMPGICLLACVVPTCRALGGTDDRASDGLIPELQLRRV